MKFAELDIRGRFYRLCKYVNIYVAIDYRVRHSTLSCAFVAGILLQQDKMNYRQSGSLFLFGLI